MKALTIRQPWATLIALRQKQIETRGWSTRHRGPIAIHAGKARPEPGEQIGDFMVCSYDGDLYLQTACVAYELTLGAVIATVQLVDVVPTERVAFVPDRQGFFKGRSWVRGAEAPGVEIGVRALETELQYGDFGPGRYAWLLEDVQFVLPPREVPGRQGLWEWPEGER